MALLLLRLCLGGGVVWLRGPGRVFPWCGIPFCMRLWRSGGGSSLGQLLSESLGGCGGGRLGVATVLACCWVRPWNAAIAAFE